MTRVLIALREPLAAPIRRAQILNSQSQWGELNMRSGFLKFLRRAQSMRGATSAEYALCCALLLVFVAGPLGGISRGVRSGFEGLQTAPSVSIASMSCASCASLGSRGGPVENLLEGDAPYEGGGSITSEQPPATLGWGDAIDEGAAIPPHVSGTPQPVQTGDGFLPIRR